MQEDPTFVVWPSYSDFTAFCSVGEFGGNFKIAAKHPDFNYVLDIFSLFYPLQVPSPQPQKKEGFLPSFFCGDL